MQYLECVYRETTYSSMAVVYRLNDNTNCNTNSIHAQHLALDLYLVHNHCDVVQTKLA